MENFKAVDEVIMVRDNHLNLKGFKYAIGQKYTVSHSGRWDWGQGEEDVICISEIYGGWLPSRLFELAGVEQETYSIY